MIKFLRPLAIVLFSFLCCQVSLADENRDTAVRRAAPQHSYGTYAGEIRTPDGHMDTARLLSELGELHANTYNWLISRANTDWDDLHTFLPLAQTKGIRVWVTLLPPSESAPKTKHNSEPFRLDYERWAAELAELSSHERALVAWSLDDFAYNLKTFSPDYMQKVIAVQRAKNPDFAFVPCIYYKQATSALAERYKKFFDGILFPYRSESSTAGFKDADSVVSEVKSLKQLFGEDFPIVVDIYATRHSRLGPSTPEYVEQVIKTNLIPTSEPSTTSFSV
jgi:hypothetical protein